MTRRVLPVLFAVLLAALPTAAQESRIILQMEEFMPASADLYLSLPNAATAMAVLDRVGDSEAAFAGRLASRSGGDREAVAAALKELVAAVDGPVTFSRHRLKMPGRPETAELLVTLATTRKDERMKDAALAFFRTAVVSAKKVVGERIMDIPTLHFAGKDGDLYFAEARGYVIVCTSPFLLGRLLREMQGPSVHTLKYQPEFKGAADARKATPGAGLFWIRKAGLPSYVKKAGVAGAFGRLVAMEKGYRDEVVIRPEKNGLLKKLSETGGMLRAWADTSGEGVWLGASLTKAGVLNLAVAVLHPDHVLSAMHLDRVATGGVEFLWQPGKRPAIAIEIAKGKDRKKASLPLEGLAAVRADGALVVSEDIDAAAPLLKAKAPDRPPVVGGARLRARVSVLLGLFGRKAAKGQGETTWVFTPDSGGVRVTCGLGEIGPIQALTGALLR